MTISKLEWGEWKDHPVTRAYYKALDERIHDLTLELQTVEPEGLKYRQGAIQALLDVTNAAWEDV